MTALTALRRVIGDVLVLASTPCQRVGSAAARTAALVCIALLWGLLPGAPPGQAQDLDPDEFALPAEGGAAGYLPEAGPWYIVGNLGMFAAHGAEVEGAGDITFKPNIRFGGGIGYRVSPVFRLEGEISHRESELESLFANGGLVVQGVEGDMNSTSTMVNLMVDFPVWEGGRWRPYAGVGLGYSWVEFTDVRGNVLGGQAYGISGDDGSFAYQATLGLDYAFSRRVMFGLGYQYWGAQEVAFSDSRGLSYKIERIGGHELLGRLRYHF